MNHVLLAKLLPSHINLISLTTKIPFFDLLDSGSAIDALAEETSTNPSNAFGEMQLDSYSGQNRDKDLVQDSCLGTDNISILTSSNHSHDVVTTLCPRNRA